MSLKHGGQRAAYHAAHSGDIPTAIIIMAEAYLNITHGIGLRIVVYHTIAFAVARRNVTLLSWRHVQQLMALRHYILLDYHIQNMS